MGHTYSRLYIHLVFSTKNREPIIRPEFEKELWAYMGGIARNHNLNILAAGGTANHIHLLLSMSTTMPLCKAVQHIKGRSSKYINDQLPEEETFKWQKGYGAFSINESLLPVTVKYINRQKEHHRERTFGEEYIRILKKHHIEYEVTQALD